MHYLIKSIGLPSMYEMLAEECTELAQASLKVARVLRGENPTPKTYREAVACLNEEAADVMLCISMLINDDRIDRKEMDSIKESKMRRWEERVKGEEDVY